MNSSIVEHIKDNFSSALLSESSIQGQTALKIAKENIKQVLAFVKEQSYRVLIDLTGIDYLAPVKGTEVVYLLQNPETTERVWIQVFIPREEPLPSIVDLWPGADWYERELYDLFGVNVSGHPHLRRILMPDEWVGHPLRKDYALTEEVVQFKHGVIPKVPSEIIPSSKRKMGHQNRTKDSFS